MLPQLSRLFDSIERRKGSLLDTLTGYSAAQLAYRPSAAEWSPLQVLDHLVLVESAILDAMIRSIPHAHGVPLGDRVKGRMLEMLFYSPARVKAPAKTPHILPRGELTLPAHAAAWTFVRTRMAAMLESVQPEAVRTGAFRHPVSGLMDVPQTLRFLGSHIVHHNYQLRRYVRQQKA